jgi:cytochrome c peroxidase
MRRPIFAMAVAVFSLGGLVLAGCAGGDGGSDAGTDAVNGLPMEVLRTLSPLPAIPPDPTNAYADNAAAAQLGQRFFFDKAYSGPLGAIGVDGGLGSLGETGKVSCESCHLAASKRFIDTRSNPPNVSSGAAGFQSRNTTAMVNNVFYVWFNSNGGRDTQWVAGTSVEGAASVNSTRCTLAHRIFNAYGTEYDAVFTPKLDPDLDPGSPDAGRFPAACRPKARPTDPDGPWEGMTAQDQLIINTILANFAKATGAYLRLLVSRNAPFDRFIAGDDAAISASAKRGAALFVGKGRCILCHSGPAFTDNDFHNLGVPQTGPNVPARDDGHWTAIPGLSRNQFSGAGAFSDNPDVGAAKLAGLMQQQKDVGAFRTSTLRDIAETAPYMHTGGFPTLESVVDFYDVGGGTVSASDGGTDGGPPPPIKSPLLVPLNLTAEEKADLVEFMKTLTGEPVPAALTTDTSAP